MLQNNKKLSLSQRIQIEQLINQRQSKSQIASLIDKSLSTVSREIHKHRIFKQHYVYSKDNFFNCKFFVNCKLCTGKCKMYMPIPCKDRDRSIGACNNCSKLKTCKLDKYFYFAQKAHERYLYTLRDSRQGVNLNSSELFHLAHIICPLIKQGQSIYTILHNHPEINLCEKTIYNYIDMGLFNDWGVNNLTLKRKVKRRVSKKYSCICQVKNGPSYI